MATFICKMCGGTLEIQPGDTVAVCDSCGSKQTIPNLSDERRANLYDRANHFRRANEFDKAMGLYEQILNEDNNDAEAHWSVVLCRYGIEYVEDPATHKRVPTVNRTQYTSIFSDEDYKEAIRLADGYQRDVFQTEAKAIDEIQKGILAISRREEPFDVFISYKETDASGRRTPDSVLATDLYQQLTKEGFKVFLSRITLESKLGQEYEPYIFAALHSAKVMVVVGTKPEYFNAVWVKNEWSRYLALIRSGEKKTLIPAYRDMDPYDLPDEFSHLMAQDMSKLGFMQDLIRGIKKLTQNETPKKNNQEPATVINAGAAGATTSSLLKRVYMFLADGDWKNADDYCERVLDIDPENAKAYVGKLMAYLHVKKQEDLQECAEPFDDDSNYQKALRFADPSLKKELQQYNQTIRNRNEEIRKEAIYNNALRMFQEAESESEYLYTAKEFESIPNFRGANAKAKQCRERADEARKNNIYSAASQYMAYGTIEGYKKAVGEYSKIRNWRDSENKILLCDRKIKELENQQREQEKERARRAEENRQKVKKALTIFTLVAVTAITIFCGVWLFRNVIVPEVRYSHANKLMEEQKYTEAIAEFENLNGYKDSKSLLQECREAIKEQQYLSAVQLMKEEKYEQAISILKELGTYKDSADKITACEKALAYNAAITIKSNGNYEEAITAFEKLGSYRDCSIQIQECEEAIKEQKYQAALSLEENGEYTEAIKAFEEILYYKDSADQITTCEEGIIEQKYQAALSLEENGEYTEAIKVFEEILDYKDSADQITACEEGIIEQKYQVALVLEENGEYTEAIKAFEEILEYKDSADQIAACEEAIIEQKYQAALVLEENGKYLKAIDAFTEIGFYKDSKDHIIDCQNAIKEQSYLQAVELYHENKYIEAIKIFQTILGYKDVDNILKTDEKMANLVFLARFGEKGNVVEFGTYEQDADVENGAEAIEWLVLTVEDRRALVVSTKVLDSMPYHSKYNSAKWEDSELNEWLNDNFYSEAFSVSEKQIITEFDETYGGKVFLLSQVEVASYFDSPKKRQCQPTAYAAKQGVYISKENDDCCWWWLRNESLSGKDAAYVSTYGGISYNGVRKTTGKGGVRPALWIDIAPVSTD